MEKILRALVDRRIVIIAFVILLLYLGKVAYVEIPKESNPDIKIPIFQVSVYYRGVSPEDSERLLVRPLENALRSISGIKEVTAYAFESQAVIVLEFYAGIDNKKALDDVRAKINDTQKDLPADADRPEIIETDFSLKPVLNVILTGDIPMQSLIKIGRELRDKVEAVPQVRQVTIGGDLEDVIEIIVEPKTLETYKLPLASLRQLIDGNNKLVTAGTLKGETGEFAIKLPSVIKDVTELLNFPVQVEGDSIVRLQDVAKVKRTFKDPENIARVNGKPAVVLEVAKRAGENIIETVAKVKEIVTAESAYWPAELRILYSQDESHNIIEMVADLENTLILAMLLVMAVIILSVGVRAAVLISFALPTSFLAGILMLYLGGYTLNVVVLFSLILSVGMIVDDAIVISEYADRKAHEGQDMQESFISAAVRMCWPIVTSTLVKLIVFMPLLFWPGVIGQFMKFMPITVITVLSNSLIYALFIQPVLGPYLGKDKKNHSHEEDIDNLEKLRGGYLLYYNLLQKVIQYPAKFTVSIFVILVLVYIAFFKFGVGMEFFPKIEPERATVAVISPGNLSIKQKDAIMKEVESLIADMTADIAIFYTKSGNFIGDNSVPKDTIGAVQLELVNWQHRRKAKYIMADIRQRLQQINGVEVQIIEARDGPPSQKPITFDLTARDFHKAEVMAQRIVSAMQQIGGFKDIETSMASPAIEWQILVERGLAARHFIDIGTVGDAVQLVTNGLLISKYRPDDTDDEVDVVLRFPPDSRNISTLNELRVTNINNETVPISNFIQNKPQLRVDKIRKVNRSRVVTIMSNVEEGLLADNQLRKLREWMAKSNWNPEVKILFRGEDRDQNEAQNFLSNAFLLTLVMMFMIMLIQFNNVYHAFIIMTAVFLSTVGVLLGLLITAQPFGVVMCGVGVIALGGIVLNNNILFVDTYQYLRKQGQSVEQAVIGAGVQRLRPILLTAITAILGLMPMVLGLTINFYDREITYDAPSSQWWRQLSASIAGGLTFATMLTLFFTPALLLLGRRFDGFKD